MPRARPAPAAARPLVAATPMAFVKAIVHAFALRGLSSQGALEAAQIAPADLKRVGARITALQMEWLGLGLDPQPPPRGRARETGEAWVH